MTTESTAPRLPIGAIFAVPLVVALVLTLFAWPAARLEPRDLPVGVAGPAATVRPVARQLESQQGAFDVHRYATEGAAREAIRDREVYGAIVGTREGLKVLIASAASQPVAQLLAQAAPAGQAEDVVPGSPRAGALAASVLPMVIAGLITGVVASFIAGRAALRRIGLVVAGSVLGGLAATLIVQTWLGVVEGAWLANAGALSLTILAIAAPVAALEAFLGRAGILIGVLLMVVIGNPFSGVATAPELLPEPVGDLGQLLPPGAGGNLLRSTGFFDGAGGGGHIAVLAVWALAGVAALVVAQARARRPALA